MSNPFITTQVKCSVCGKLKGETNHWWAVVPKVVKTLGVGLVTSASFVAVTITKLGSDLYLVDDMHPACGTECVIVLVDRYMSGKELV